MLKKYKILNKINDEFLEDANIVNVDRYHCAVVVKDNCVYGIKPQYREGPKYLGIEANGQPQKIATIWCGVKQIACCNIGGVSHVLILSKDGDIHAWGYSQYGQLGHGTTTESTVTVKPNFPQAVKVVIITAGLCLSMALSENGDVYCWGYSRNGQCGQMSTNVLSPTVMGGMRKVIAISCGTFHCVALTTTGDVYTWGNNES